MNKLPDKASDLLRLAVLDSKKLEGRSDHQFDMSRWLYKNHDGICHTCMAGAVMLCSLEKQPNYKDEAWLIHYFKNNVVDDDDTIKKLDWINVMRTGGFNFLLYENPNQSITISLCEDIIKNDYNIYIDRASWGSYLKVADILESIGL